MTLEEFRKLEGLSLEKLGELIGVGEETARRYCLPETHPMSRFPPRHTLHRIFEATCRRVTPNDFLNLG